MSPAGLLLYPGAGADRDQAALVALDEALSDVVAVRRADFAYRRAGRPFPPRVPTLIPEVVDAAEAFAADLGATTDRLVVGGRSMGGRVCSLAVAEGLAVAGLALVSYPLHPAGKPDRLRTEHFGDLDVPCLFVSGTDDDLGSPDEFDQHLTAIPGEVTRVLVAGKRHDLRNADEAVADAVRAWLADLS